MLTGMNSDALSAQHSAEMSHWSTQTFYNFMHVALVFSVTLIHLPQLMQSLAPCLSIISSTSVGYYKGKCCWP